MKKIFSFIAISCVLLLNLSPLHLNKVSCKSFTNTSIASISVYNIDPPPIKE